MRVLLAGGGTGGHIFPLVAVARKLKEIFSNQEEMLELLFIGPEAILQSVFSNEGIPARKILAGKFRRYLSPLNIIDSFKLPVGLLQAYWHIFRFMPDVIFAKGGYGSVPAVLIGWLFKIPIIIHESDIIPGLANRLLAKFAKRVLVSFDYTISFFPQKKTIVVGNPIRETLFSNIPKNAREILGIVSDKPIVLIIGGSQGAQEINDLVILALPILVKKYEILHQCGESNFAYLTKGEFVQLRTREEKELYHIYATLNEQELAAAYYLSGIVVSRAGSGAIFEIAASGKPSILIPYFGAAGAHQFKNAEVYEQAGACRIVRGRNLMPHIFIEVIDSIVEDSERWRAMSSSALYFAKPEAAQLIANEVLKYLG